MGQKFILNLRNDSSNYWCFNKLSVKESHVKHTFHDIPLYLCDALKYNFYVQKLFILRNSNYSSRIHIKHLQIPFFRQKKKTKTNFFLSHLAIRSNLKSQGQSSVKEMDSHTIQYDIWIINPPDPLHLLSAISSFLVFELWGDYPLSVICSLPIWETQTTQHLKLQFCHLSMRMLNNMTV